MKSSQRLPKPLLARYEWQEKGRCRNLSVEVFFEADGIRGPRRRRWEEAAKQVCAQCPVITECRAHAVAAEDYGVWGGLTAQERLDLRGGWTQVAAAS